MAVVAPITHSRRGRTDGEAGARERILDAASRLFYEEGIQAVGIQKIIEEANTVKASLYAHFKSKDELVAAYLRGRHEAWWQRLEAAQACADDPDEKILAVFDAIADYVSLPEFRGCPFDNAAAEAPAGECQKQANKEYRDWLRQYFLELAAATGVADSQALADALVVLYNGALATASTAEPRAPRGSPPNASRG